MVSSRCFELQDAGLATNGNVNAPVSEGMNGGEVARRINQSVSFSSVWLLLSFI